MATISFAKNRAPLTVASDANLMEVLQKAGIPVASSCGGSGVCTKCKIQVLKGRENLSLPNELEAFIQEIHAFAPNERLSCQVQVLGDIQVDATYW